jgi:GT2 family glycosyltransferase
VTSHRLTVGITTRDRPESLNRCVRSLTHIAHLEPEIIVFDDGSRVPVTEQLEGISDIALRVIRCERGAGYITGRNQIVREADNPFVLLLDDDASLLDGASVVQALSMLTAQPRAGAIAFAQTTRTGRRWGDPAVNESQTEPCFVPSFYGFAHLVRRDIFLALGGYRDRFEFYGEEKEFCLRLIDAGYRTVYLPGSRVAHEPDPLGRDRQRYLRYVTRNDALQALYNEPVHRLIWMLPARLFLYFRMRRAWRIDDPFGWAWVLSELTANLRPVLRDRRPMSARTRRLWRELGRAPSPVLSTGEQGR